MRTRRGKACTELNDLSARMPDRAARMMADYTVWAQRCGVAPWAEIRPAGNGKKKKG